MSQAYSIESNLGLIHSVAGRVFKRTKAMHLNLDYDDVFQEFCIVYLKSLKAFDSSKGKFSTYFTTSAYHSAEKLIEREAKYDIETSQKSLHSFVDGSEKDHLIELTDGGSAPDIKVEAIEAYEAVYKKMSPLAKRVIDMAVEPPQMLIREMEMSQMKNDIAVQRGTAIRCRRVTMLSASIQLVSTLCNLSEHSRRLLRAEIKPVSDFIG